MKIISVLILIAVLSSSFCNINFQNDCKVTFRVTGEGKNSNMYVLFLSPCMLCFVIIAFFFNSV